jgi:sterol desaturase/sphingolipid hydroxylase (fatty acid hydroxylase superfamily)
MKQLQTILNVLGLVVLGSALLEVLVMKFLLKRDFNWRSSLASFGVLVGRSFSEFIPVFIAMPGAFWLYEHRLFQQSNRLWSWLVLFVGLEFVYYWWHRISHRSRWFWTNHAVHHSPNELNFAAAFRVGWTARLMATYVVFAPLVLLGFEPQIVFMAYALNLSYQFWIHADWIPRLGPLEGIVNTPAAHRVHHASNLEYLDANYGGVLMVFDRLFGTYRAERDDVRIRYGLVEPLYSYNPFKIVFHQFGPLFRDLRGARNAREVLGYLFGPPGWKPNGQGKTTEDLRRMARLSRGDSPVGAQSQAV